jgi:ABC-type Mn2+/Zn2+ transport system ATPase subunit
MNYISIILAILVIESGGNDLAVGDNGMSLGCLQLTEAYVQDASEHANIDWVHNDAFNRQKSIDIFNAYMSRYATPKRLGRPVTVEDIVRIHNGGPNGYKKQTTKKYWQKVKKLLDATNRTQRNNI